ncbi:MAG: mlaD [Gammaproteobacteria bacterium]|nr:mlaD [Gammaproteobacteria bacterium]
MGQKSLETLVGFFILLAIAGLLMLAFKVSNLTTYQGNDTYDVKAQFDNIGDLKVRAPVTVAGVKVGQVGSIVLDPQNYRATVILRMDKSANYIPDDSSASIFTAGLLGSNYISLSPGFATQFLKDGDVISETHSAIVLEQMIGQLLFNVNKNKAGAGDSANADKS